MSPFFRILSHLFPTGEAWRLGTGKVLTRFVQGLAPLGDDVRSFANDAYLDLFPQHTRELEEWETFYGLTANASEAARRLALAAEWRSTGGQSAKYIEGVLQTAGFQVWVHEWFNGNPADQGTPTLWYRADDLGAVLVSNEFTSLPDRGSHGETWVPIAADSRPNRSTLFEKNSTFFSNIDRLRAPLSSATALVATHDAASNATIAFFVSTTKSAAYRLIYTSNATQPQVGILFDYLPSGRYQLRVSNGTGTSPIVAMSAVMSSPGDWVFEIVKTGPSYEVYRNGVLIISASGAGLSSDPPTFVMRVGAGTAGTDAVEGHVPEVIFWRKALNEEQRASVRRYLSRWTRVKPWVARNPREFSEDPRIGTIQCSTSPDICGWIEAQCDAFLSNDPGYIVNLNLSPTAPPPVPSDPAKWPYFLYIAGQSFPSRGWVQEARRAEFERLIQKLKPSQQWLITMVDYMPPGFVLLDSNNFVQVDDDGFVLTT